AVLQPLKRDLALSDQQLGWLASAYIIVLAVAALPLGALADLKSRRGVIAWGVGLWSAFTALGGLVQRFWQLFVCRALVGIGEAGYGPASQALIAEYFRGQRRAFAICVYWVGMAFGGVPSEVDAAVFGVFATVGFVWTVWRLVPAAVRRTTEAGEVATTAFEDFLEAASVVLRTPTLIWVFVGGALVTFAVDGLIAWASSFMQRLHGMTVT